MFSFAKKRIRNLDLGPRAFEPDSLVKKRFRPRKRTVVIDRSKIKTDYRGLEARYAGTLDTLQIAFEGLVTRGETDPNEGHIAMLASLIVEESSYGGNMNEQAAKGADKAIELLAAIPFDNKALERFVETRRQLWSSIVWAWVLAETRVIEERFAKALLALPWILRDELETQIRESVGQKFADGPRIQRLLALADNSSNQTVLGFMIKHLVYMSRKVAFSESLVRFAGAIGKVED